MAAEQRLCLSREEIAELTRAHTRAKQLAFLRRNGIRHYVDNAGWPVVTVAAVEGQTGRASTPKPAWNPNKAA
ncbi:DUF4224 domain-containing protein [Luteibacter flocculans]|uniref:DUF4224 domain-containing protein n=1 Tax=Luteibacter flocculans TaxID=2780091 RepID=A0ABY4T676_9GAMM|nr:DUF4224 domain-containing protein [Luteibacter flocculans]URL59577.1 DUF4224 domain-containing protein [Luteibacter flocculans]